MLPCDGVAVAVGAAVVADADVDGEVGGSSAPYEGEEPHPAASAAERANTIRLMQTVTQRRVQHKRSAESLIAMIPSALLEVFDI